MSERPKAIYIEIRYADGSRDVAEGEAATQIKGWYDGAEGLYCVHGATYRGTKFTHFEPQERHANDEA